MTRAARTIILSTAIGLALVATATADPAADVKAAKAAIARGLKDPASARFEEVHAKAGAVCGFVNARTSAGGYAGRTPFVYVTGSAAAFILDPASDEGPTWAAKAIGAYQRYCS
jgi:hypothetical protein